MFREDICCRRKIRYTNPILFWRRYIDLGTNVVGGYRRRLCIYKCKLCKGFHLGNVVRNKRMKGEVKKGKGIIAKMMLKAMQLKGS